MSTMTTTYAPREFAFQQPPAVEDARLKPWGFWATCGWLVVAAAVCTAVSVLCVLGYGIWWVATHDIAELNNLELSLESPALVYLISLLSMPAAALVLLPLARQRASSVRSYLALTVPSGRHVMIGLALVAVTWLCALGLGNLFPSFDQSAEFIRHYREMMGNPWLLALFWAVLVITAPVSEEIIYRGFLLRGWSASLGSFGAVLLVALVFALSHPQYNVMGLFTTFCVGLICGVMRWRSGSTVTAIIMHSSWNLSCGVYYALSA